MIDAWIDRSFVHCDRVEQHFEQISIMGTNSTENSMWRFMCVVVIWGIWNHENRVIFKEAVVDSVEILTITQIKA